MGDCRSGAVAGREAVREVEGPAASDQAEVDFEEWRHWFEVALSGTATTAAPWVGVVIVENAAGIADAAAAKVRERRALGFARASEPPAASTPEDE